MGYFDVDLLHSKLLRYCFAGLALVAFGCSHSDDMEDRGRAFTPVLAARPPAFVSRPMAVLLTNRTGYSAHVDAQTESLAETERSISGQLLCRGSKLFFASELSGDSNHASRPGGFSYIWDVAGNSGYVLSEALQGYAPVGSNARATNVVTGTGQAAPKKIAGYACTSETIAVQMDDGSTANFQVLRAAALGGFPVRITAFTNSVPLTITFSKIKMDAPPADLFSPPEGFSKYPSPEAMSDEIAVRQHNLRRKNASPMEPLQLPPTGPAQRY
jgi:hypothetical protein